MHGQRSSVALRYAMLVALAGLTIVAAALPGHPLRLILLFALATGAFAALLAAETIHPQLGVRAVLLTSGLLVAAMVALPPRDSDDVWTYVMQGRILAVHHSNPYDTPPEVFPSDPFFERTSPRWRDSPALYGPLFIGLSALAGRSAGDSPLAARLSFQSLAALGVLATLLLLHKTTQDHRALMFIGLSPLVLVEVVNGAHNDALVGLAALGGVLLVASGRSIPAGLVLACGALLKPVGILPLLGLGVWSAMRMGPRAALRVTGVALGVTIAAYSLLAPHLWGELLGPGAKILAPYSVWNLPRLAHGLFEPSGLDAREWPGRLSTAVPPGAAVLAAGVALVALLRYLRDPSPVLATAAPVMAYALTAPYALPWYVMWGLPVLALVYRDPLARTGQAIGALLVAAYARFGVTRAGNAGRGNTLRAYLLAFVVAEVVLVAWLLGRSFQSLVVEVREWVSTRRIHGR